MTDFFIIRDGEEFGPFTWIDVYLGLLRGEVDESDLVRIDDGAEVSSISELGFWSEGADVGPFSWEEISLLLREAGLEASTPAKLEGQTEFSTLGRLGLFRPQLFGDLILRKAIRTPLVWVGCGALLLLFLAVGAIWPKLTGPVASKADRPPQIAASEPDLAANSENPQQVVPMSSQEGQGNPEKGITRITRTEGEDTVKPLPRPVSSPESFVKIEESPTPNAQPALIVGETEGGKAINGVAATSPTPKTLAVSASPSTYAEKALSKFFDIQSVKFLKNEPKDGVGVWRLSEQADKKKTVPPEFMQCLQVEVGVAENIYSEKTYAKAYFFDESKKLLATCTSPSKAGKRSKYAQFSMPIIFKKDESTKLYFEVPAVLSGIKWTAVVVFGDRHEARSSCYPINERDFLLQYPEKELVYQKVANANPRKAAIDPLIQHVVKTRNPQVPQITLLLRTPKGIADASEIKGVVALSILAGSVDQLKRELQKEELSGDYNGLFAFANKNKLAVLAWGSSSALWLPENYDEASKDKAKAREAEKSIMIVANAWERGVLEMGEKYGIPTKNFLLWGQCGSAHWAQALCLLKPDFFLAIHIHIPGYFERPTPEASKVLWCITTGELYFSYKYSLRFFEDCKKLGYPIMYKAFVGLGHSGHPDATRMGLRFFEFALTQKERREAYDLKLADNRLKNDVTSDSLGRPWPECFQNPAYFGDVVNQAIYPKDKIELIPPGFRTAIPTTELAEIWEKRE